jgi:hypothetical protein
VDLFYGGQWVLEWNCSLFQLNAAWTQNNANARGMLYNATSPNPGWTYVTSSGVSLSGDGNPCPNPAQGNASFMVEWSGYYWVNNPGPLGHYRGVNVTAPPAGPAEGRLIRARWQTYGALCGGTTFNSGTTDIGFKPELALTGFLDGAYDYPCPVIWTDTSVTVN